MSLWTIEGLKLNIKNTEKALAGFKLQLKVLEALKANDKA